MARDTGGQTDNVIRTVVPSPDPTTLTTESLLRETNALREILEARIIGMERDLARLQGEVNDSPQGVESRVSHLESLHSEKFRSIETQFRERDIRTDQTARDNKVAVDAALQSAKEAVHEQNRSSALAIAKSEAGTMKQIDQMGTLIQSTTNALNDKIDDLKSRLTSMKDEFFREIGTLRDSQARGLGANNQSAMGRANSQFLIIALIGFGGLLLTAIGVAVTWMIATK